jgi:hypothetical protein
MDTNFRKKRRPLDRADHTDNSFDTACELSGRAQMSTSKAFSRLFA